ncbi:MAG: hypothetical protein HOJ67_18725 [Rhodospirillaceae bacterium]|nr:hypothetical protein [Rhodospirillales bacterium]MBT5036018.1 hypothetical protein [Rhodospirillaceae bacterium]MBT6220598.1 hypothetical protein [Rhodospirillaceae bacterium]MBT6364237.1 hypothetical protein [Rhodospirillaceae bacterium]
MNRSLGTFASVKSGLGQQPCRVFVRVFLIAFVLTVFTVVPAIAQSNAPPPAQERPPAGVTFSRATENLFMAVRLKDLNAVKMAIKEGAKIYATNRKGTSPVGLAVDKGYFEIAHYLLRLRGERDKKLYQTEQPKPKGAWTPKVTLAKPDAPVKLKPPVAEATPKPTGPPVPLTPSEPTVTAELPKTPEEPGLLDSITIPPPPRTPALSDTALQFADAPSPELPSVPEMPTALEPPKEEIPTAPIEALKVPTETAELPIPSGLPEIDLPELPGEPAKLKEVAKPDDTAKPDDGGLSLPSLGSVDEPKPVPPAPAPTEPNDTESIGVEIPTQTPVPAPVLPRQKGSSPSISLISKLKTSFDRLTNDLIKGSDTADKARTSKLVNKFEESFDQFAKRYIRERGPAGANEPGAAGRLISEVREAYLRLIQGTVSPSGTPPRQPQLAETGVPETEAEVEFQEAPKTEPGTAPLPSEEGEVTFEEAPVTKSAQPAPSTTDVPRSQRTALQKMREKVLNTWRFLTGSPVPEEKPAKSAPRQTEIAKKPKPAPEVPPTQTPEIQREATAEVSQKPKQEPTAELPGLPELPGLGEPDTPLPTTTEPSKSKDDDQLAFLPPPKGYEHLAKPGESEDGGSAGAKAVAKGKAPTLEQQLDQAFSIPGLGDDAPQTPTKPSAKPKKDSLDAKLDDAFSIPSLEEPSKEKPGEIPGLPGLEEPDTKPKAPTRSNKYKTVGPGPSGPAPVGAQPKKSEGGLIDKLVDMVQPDELSSPKETAATAIDNSDESGWGVKKIERADTPLGKTAPPKGVPQAPGKYMSNVVLTIGESMRLGRTTSDRDGNGADTDTCVIKRRGTVAFCIEPATWPEAMVEHFTVDSVMYQGPMAVTRYDDGVATNHHVIFDSKSFGNVVDYYKSRFGNPTSVISRGIAPMGEPRRGNPVAMWQSVDPKTNLVTTLEVRKFDDARGGFPDTDKGVVMLYHAWSSPIFPQLSTLELMVLKPQVPVGDAGTEGAPPPEDLPVPTFPGG